MFSFIHNFIIYFDYVFPRRLDIIKFLHLNDLLENFKNLAVIHLKHFSNYFLGAIYYSVIIGWLFTVSRRPMCMHVHVCVNMRDQPWVSFLKCCLSCFFKTGSLTSLELMTKLDWLAIKPVSLSSALGLQVHATTLDLLCLSPHDFLAIFYQLS